MALRGLLVLLRQNVSSRHCRARGTRVRRLLIRRDEQLPLVRHAFEHVDPAVLEPYAGSGHEVFDRS